MDSSEYLCEINFNNYQENYSYFLIILFANISNFNDFLLLYCLFLKMWISYDKFIQNLNTNKTLEYVSHII